MDIAINIQHAPTYGLFLSPILASFQKVPNILVGKREQSSYKI